MDSIGTTAGLLTSQYRTSQSIITIMVDPSDGTLMSVLVDDGDGILEYNYEKKHSGISYGTDELQWGLFA